MDVSNEMSSLSAFTALDGSAVLDEIKRGTSIQLDETYFTGQLRAMETFDSSPEDSSNSGRRQRLQDLRESWRIYKSIEINVDSLTEQSLWTTSTQFRRELQRIPEIGFLERQFPAQCFVVPEWLQTGNRLHYGARVYFLRSEDITTPEDVMQKNIDAILDGSFQEFERYQGRLHGYPDCRIDFYHERSSNAPSPEWRSISPFTNRINADALGNGISVSIDEVLPRFADWDGCSAFFARECFPEPECEMARTRGRAIYDRLSSATSTRLAEDYFRLTFGYNYLVARAVHSGGSHRPKPGELGREHLMFYLPLRELSAMPRYS